MSSTYKNKGRAVTLIEFVVSIGIIGVTLSLGAAFIRFQQPNIKLSSSSRELKSALQRSRDYSLTRQNTFGIKFLPIENKYQLVQGQQVLEEITLPTMVQFYSVGPFAGNTINFSSAGAASEAGTIVLQSSDNRQKQIIISPSGYVRIE